MESNTERAKAVYVAFLARLEEGEAIALEGLVREYKDLESELRRLHAAHEELVKLMGGSSEHIEYGHELLEELGAGGSGRVFRARDKTLNRDVAIKVLADASSASPQLRQLFIEEARAMASIRHENVIQIYGVEEVEGTIRLVMELIEGRAFESLVDQDGTLSATEAARVGTDLCRALGALHSKGLVHLDLKPGNVMREKGGRTVLLDFGLASSPDLENVRLGGTPPFMAPEQFGRGEPGPSCDVYGLGATLYALTSGCFPFKGESVKEIAMQVLAGQLEPLTNLQPALPAAFVAIVEKAMSCSPRDRYPTIGHMERALREFVTNHASTVVVAQKKRSKTLLVAGLVGVLVVGGSLATSLFSKPRLDVQTAITLISPNGEESPLSKATTVQVGDKLYLTAKGSEPFYLYVFNEDEKGERYTLYPRKQKTWSTDNEDEGEDGNRNTLSPRTQSILPADIELRLPTDNTSWKVTSAGGAEHIFVIASRTTDPFAEMVKSKILMAKGRASGTTRGISTEAEEEDKEGLETTLLAAFEAYDDRVGEASGTLLVHWTIAHSE